LESANCVNQTWRPGKKIDVSVAWPRQLTELKWVRCFQCTAIEQLKVVELLISGQFRRPACGVAVEDGHKHVCVDKRVFAECDNLSLSGVLDKKTLVSELLQCVANRHAARTEPLTKSFLHQVRSGRDEPVYDLISKFGRDLMA
jgi:hypothetical protein